MEERRDFRHDWGFRDERIARVVRELKEKNEVKMGDAFVVRIPKIEGKISLRKGEYADYVEYKVDGWYDPEKKQNRNRKVIIGQVIYPIPGSMLPNENYYKYFDRETGKEKKNGEEAEEMEQEAEGTAEGTSTCVSRKEMIRNVMEEDGVIRRRTERMREAIRDGYENVEEGIQTDSDWEEEGISNRGEMEGENAEGERRETPITEETRRKRRRLRVLLDVLTSIRDVVKEQAKRRPKEMMNEYQIQKINPVLEEIREIEKEMGMEDLLEIINEPKEGEEMPENKESRRMSYSDIEVLLEYYNSVIWYTQGDLMG